MSYFSDLHLRLCEAGHNPETMPLPTCPHCGCRMQILAFEEGTVIHSCRSTACIERKRRALDALGGTL